MWTDSMLKNINSDLRQIEIEKKEKQRAINQKIYNEQQELKHLAQQRMLNPYGFMELKDSIVWSRTIAEDQALAEAHKKLDGYKARHETQQKVLNFAKLRVKYTEFNPKSGREVEKYCQASSYWKKNSITAENKKSQRIKVVYYYNEQMKSVITEYLGKKIITTESSFDNIIRHMEDKLSKHKKQFDKTKPPAGVSMMEYRERLDKSVPKKEDIVNVDELLKLI